MTAVKYDNPVYQKGDEVILTLADGTLVGLINGESVQVDEVPDGLESDPNVKISGHKKTATKDEDQEGGES